MRKGQISSSKAGFQIPSIATLVALTREVFQLQPSHSYIIQLARSLIVSVISLIVDFATLVVLKQKFGVFYLLAATIGFSVGVLVNYILSVRWVFASHKLSSRTHEFIFFVIITGLGLVFNLLIIAGIVELLHLDYRIGKIIATVVVFFWNFLMRKKVLY